MAKKSAKKSGSSTAMTEPWENDEMPLVGVIMGSSSDWEYMQHTHQTLRQFEIRHECRVVSAHRTPTWMADYALDAKRRGIKVLIAGAGGAAHLPGMTAAHTILPVLGVPVPSTALSGMDSLLSIVQMPGGVPVGTLAIGKPGAINAALLAGAILALNDEALAGKLDEFRQEQQNKVLGQILPPM
jgi:5-(carboxyamino)imidazole ribonucleotide mutase